MLPSQKEIEIPLLQVLVELGGQARPKDIYPLVAKKFPEVPKVKFEERHKSGRNKWNNRVQFTRQTLKDKGEIDSPARGIWRITQKGRERVLAIDKTLDSEPYKYLKGMLVSGEALQTAARIRKNDRTQKSVPKEQVKQWIDEGYSVEREFSRNARVSKLKPVGERFENEIWLLMKQLGFSTMNRSRKFYIDISIPSN